MLTRLDENLWTMEGGPISFLGFPYMLRMVLIRLGEGSLWIHSPIKISPKLCESVDEIGPVRCLVSPNRYHHLFLQEWATEYPDAKLFGTADLLRKRRDIPFAGALCNQPEAAWAEDIDQCRFSGSFFWNEIVFFHRSTGTVIFGDLIENHDPARFSLLRRKFARVNGMFGSTPKNLRITFYDRARARQSFRRILDWKPQRVVVMHGPIVDHDAEQFLRRAFAWVRI